ncbi:unnamed protein product [Mytilus coruscus]|uniref:FAD dependent oxidoreductase domain-containing protein n=1 Tax=Mytilus coruscus TaxID=42192 RepID=A0A6J8BYI8_MYTCO|nr:unnamed protein product [Mytilus coruscus]
MRRNGEVYVWLDQKNQRNVNDKRDIYGCHYDEGRITRCTDPDPVWAMMAQKSIARYRQLERDTGIPFYDEIGCLMIGEKDSKFLNQVTDVVKTQKMDAMYLTNAALKDKFPFLHVSISDDAVYEFKDAGNISPRSLISAQITKAMSQGCHLLPEVANCVRRIERNGEYVMCISTEASQILAKKVLLATGAFTGFRELLPDELQLDVNLCPLTVAKVEIPESDVERIRKMPSVLYSGKGAKDWTKIFPRSENNHISWYMLPPVKYPDGKCYIKLGHFHDTSFKRFTTSKEVKEWFCRGGDTRLVNATAELIQNVVKGVKLDRYHGDWCVITETLTGRPYIDTIHSQLGVSIGGNGYAAKSSDEIGRIAATMMMKNKWDSTIPKNVFQVKFKRESCKL